MNYSFLDSPIGPLLLVGEHGSLCAISFHPAEPREGWTRDDRALRHAAAQLREYFDGQRTAFELELAPRGTAFQLAVWNELRRIPFGETR
jgi:methylated-DNA-[protein]-cysteine S-methyltransferase